METQKPNPAQFFVGTAEIAAAFRLGAVCNEESSDTRAMEKGRVVSMGIFHSVTITIPDFPTFLKFLNIERRPAALNVLLHHTQS